MKPLRLKALLMLVMLVFSSLVYAQNTRLKGIVRDSNGEPLVGVAVAVKGTSIGTITDINGNFYEKQILEAIKSLHNNGVEVSGILSLVTPKNVNLVNEIFLLFELLRKKYFIFQHKICRRKRIKALL